MPWTEAEVKTQLFSVIPRKQEHDFAQQQYLSAVGLPASILTNAFILPHLN